MHSDNLLEKVSNGSSELCCEFCDSLNWSFLLASAETSHRLSIHFYANVSCFLEVTEICYHTDPWAWTRSICLNYTLASCLYYPALIVVVDAVLGLGYVDALSIYMTYEHYMGPLHIDDVVYRLTEPFANKMAALIIDCL